MSNDMWAELEAPQREEPASSWMLTFTDLVALLLCFFVLMYSMRELDSQGWDSLKGGMGGVFTVLASETVATAPEAMPDAEIVVRRQGSVLPYLQQVWTQKMADKGAWAAEPMRYDAESGELWVKWPEGGEVAGAVSVLGTWRNRVRLVAGNAEDAGRALGYLKALRAGGVMVAQEVRLVRGVALGVWLVVEDKQ